jgi:hypothetical protein
MKAILRTAAMCPECQHDLILTRVSLDTDEYQLRHPEHIACGNAGKKYALPVIELTEVTEKEP